MIFINESDLSSVADKIRELLKTSNKFTYPSGFIKAIKDIDYVNFDDRYGVIIGRDQPGNYSGFFTSPGSYLRLTFLSWPTVSYERLLYYSMPDFTNTIEVNFKILESIPSLIFQNAGIEIADFPNCQNIGEQAFENCQHLYRTNFPKVEIVQSMAFQNCFALSTISLPMCNTINSCAFRSCTNLKSVYLQNSNSVINIIGDSIFALTPIVDSSYLSGTYGSIYLPMNLSAQYLTSGFWRFLSDRLVFI